MSNTLYDKCENSLNQEPQNCINKLSRSFRFYHFYIDNLETVFIITIYTTFLNGIIVIKIY